MEKASYKLDSRKSMKMKDVIYVPGLKKKGFRVAFVDGEVLM